MLLIFADSKNALPFGLGLCTSVLILLIFKKPIIKLVVKTMTVLAILLWFSSCNPKESITPKQPIIYNDVVGDWTFNGSGIIATFTLSKCDTCTHAYVSGGHVTLEQGEYDVVPNTYPLDIHQPTSIYLGESSGYNIQVKILSVPTDYATMISPVIDVYYYSYGGSRTNTITIKRQ